MHVRSSTPTQDAINAYYRRSVASPARLARDIVGYGLAPNASYPFWHMTGNRRVKAKRFARLEKSHANPPDARRACSSLAPARSWSGNAHHPLVQGHSSTNLPAHPGGGVSELSSLNVQDGARRTSAREFRRPLPSSTKRAGWERLR